MKKISILQYNAIAFLLPITMFFGVGLSNIVRSSKESFWISIIIGIVLGSFIVLGFTKIFNRHKDNNLTSTSKLKSVAYALISLIFIYIGISILTNFIISIYLTEINPILIAIPLLFIMFYASSKGKVLVARVSVLIAVLSMIFALGIILNLTPEFEITNYLPLFNVKFQTVFTQGINFAIFSSSPLVLLGLYSPNDVDGYKEYSLLKIYLVSCLMITIIFSLTVGVMGVDMTTLYRYPAYIVLKRISFFRFVNNLENFIAFFWILTYIGLIIVSGSCLKESIDDIVKRKWIYPLIVLILFGIITITTFFKIEFILYLYKYLVWMLLGCIMLFFLINLKSLKNNL